jgi:hypothetical protein
VLVGVAIVDIWVVLNIKLLTVQIKGSNTQFSNPCTCHPGKKGAIRFFTNSPVVFFNSDTPLGEVACVIVCLRCLVRSDLWL